MEILTFTGIFSNLAGNKERGERCERGETDSLGRRCRRSNQKKINVTVNTQNCFSKLVRRICFALTLGSYAGIFAWPAAHAQSEQQFRDSVIVPTTNYVDAVAVG